MMILIFWCGSCSSRRLYWGDLSENVTQMQNQNGNEDSDDSSSTNYACLECERI